MRNNTRRRSDLLLAPLAHLAILPLMACMACMACMAPAALAQRGDNAGEAQPDLPADLRVPEAPALSPEEALRAFTFAEGGFRIALAAGEPMVIAPVSAVFDEDGRLWVVEMQSYMPNIDGEGELVPTSRVQVLEDTDGDWVFDRATTFLDGLVLPRSVLPCYGGALVLAPPNLLFARDTDGDGAADEVRTLLDGFGGLENPEHAGNGLLYGLDNWIHISQHNLEVRFDGENVQTRRIPGHGQWGVTQDDRGRLYYCPNSDVLRGDYFPKHYAARNPNQRGVQGMNAKIMQDTSVFPGRMNPGINRGYQEPMLRDDFTLATTTSACSPLVYRSAAFGPSFYGNSFTCEPAGNCLMYVVLDERDGVPVARRAYADTEFLCSTDERFRPVSLATGPDGSLFMVDMYRGVIQHKTYVTTFLRKQVERRRLETPLTMGRVWRISRDGAAPGERVRMSGLSNARLVSTLDHPDAFYRENAQKLLVERRATEAAGELRRLADDLDAPVTARVHALWTLEGLGELSFRDAQIAAADEDERLSVHGVRLLEAWADEGDTVLTMRAPAFEGGRAVRLQVALSLGESRLTEATRELAWSLVDNADDPLHRSAVLSGLYEREVLTLAEIAGLCGGDAQTAAARTAIAELADASLRGSPGQRTRYLDLIAEVLPTDRWLAAILLERLGANLKLESDKPGSLELGEEAAAWAAALDAGLWDLQPLASAVDARLRWPGNTNPEEQVRPLVGDQRSRFGLGRRLFDTCAACHGFDGVGAQGQAPPLAGSPIATGPEDLAIRVLLHGLQGPIERDGIVYDLQMPAAPFTEDEQIASLLTYIRRAWGNAADPVDPDAVARVRAETADRAKPWTEPELLDLP
ncbi:MAG: c-type cytochrome [Phycisphaerales bacterium]|nr:c-type cytochrome [Phycisphaerales bacterium]